LFSFQAPFFAASLRSEQAAYLSNGFKSNAALRTDCSIPQNILYVHELQKGAYLIKRCVLVVLNPGRYDLISRGKTTLTTIKEEMIMALSNLFGWGKKESPESACGAAEKPAACGAAEKPAACGAADKPAEAPAACGAADAPAACGAADKPEEKPAACGSACGAGDK
jgi:ACGX-repeat protein